LLRHSTETPKQFTLFHVNKSLAQICHLVFEASILQRFVSLADSHYSSAFGFCIPDILIIAHSSKKALGVVSVTEGTQFPHLENKGFG
jgi:hypothetical protein